MATIGAVIALSCMQIHLTDVNAAFGSVLRMDVTNVADVSKIHTTTISSIDCEGGCNLHPESLKIIPTAT
jgi:hypothetical protein